MKNFLTTILIMFLCLSMILPMGCNTDSEDKSGTSASATEAPDISSPDSAPAVESTPVAGSTPEGESTPEADADPIPTETTVSYDDYLTELLGISADSEKITVNGNGCIEVLTKNGTKYFHTNGIGTATVTDGSREVTVHVEKAKLNVIVIMGQSNSGNHFDNATSDIVNPIGTAYWWGSGMGISATAPTDFTHATKGFHSTLLAELYAQSVKNGSPEKNVLVWHEGGSSAGNGTSKNGSSIKGWATGATDASGTDYTVQMVNNCLDYYKERADRYEIVSKGVYWLQGEGDGVGNIDAAYYTECFMAMWNKLKSEAGLEYMAILRVRKGGDNNTHNNDIGFSSTVSAQFALANNNPDIYMATTITENFVGSPTTEISVDITNYIKMMEIYSAKESHNDRYGNTATFKDGILTTPMNTLYGSNNKNHYGKFGYTLIASDAAYNMYRALHGDRVAFVQANTSGKTAEGLMQINDPDTTAVININGLRDNLSFRACPGSVGGTLSIKIEGDGEDITTVSGIIKANPVHYKTVYTNGLKRYEDVKITVTYTTVDGRVESVVYTVVQN